MSIAFLLSLAALALVDSTSIGTLVIPIWLLLARKVHIRAFFVYLATVAIFYFGVGVAVLMGFSTLVQDIDKLLASTPALYMQIVIGIALFIASFRFIFKQDEDKSNSRLNRWRKSVVGGSISTKAMIGVALGATVLELATMVPYVAAIGMLTAAHISFTEEVVILAGYVLVVILPALVFFAVRMLTDRKIRPLLEKINTWLIKNTDTALGWILIIVAVILVRDAAARLLGQ